MKELQLKFGECEFNYYSTEISNRKEDWHYKSIRTICFLSYNGCPVSGCKRAVVKHSSDPDNPRLACTLVTKELLNDLTLIKDKKGLWKAFFELMDKEFGKMPKKKADYSAILDIDKLTKTVDDISNAKVINDQTADFNSYSHHIHIEGKIIKHLLTIYKHYNYYNKYTVENEYYFKEKGETVKINLITHYTEGEFTLIRIIKLIKKQIEDRILKHKL